MIRILLVDDHPSVMEGTKVLLEQEGDMHVTLAHSGAEAMGLCAEHRFDVMLIDLHMPDVKGIDLAKRILALLPEAIILIYTGFEFKTHFNLMIEAGIAGFVLKTAHKEQLVAAVRCALRGEVILPLSLVKQLRRTTDPVNESAAEPNALSKREYDILKQIAQGRSNKEIAESLLMSQRSLEYCLTDIFHKLKVKSRIEAAVKAKQMGLLADPDYTPTSL
ncbi:response regulator [Paenibacillus flagellatus]|uniref:DNA-binding response regulator n=1 Tax=Paenibacillus flagellatus TaxID=2211139 RepID=A0A2V5KEK5_9BACL|nr:response regulator transcription factor [Paenibacillus flagellatus]PYI56563.1 DNA-binding response regulator [Paenibacillus flagellatus]